MGRFMNQFVNQPAVRLDNKYSYINTKGEVEVKARFD